MTWKDVPVFDINGRRYDFSVGLMGFDSDETDVPPTDLVLQHGPDDDVVLVEAGPGFGRGFRIKLKESGSLESGELRVSARQRGTPNGTFGLRVVDLVTGDVLVEETDEAGKWIHLSVVVPDDETVAAQGILWSRRGTDR